MTSKEIQLIIEDKVTGVWVPEHDDQGHHYRNTITGDVVDSVTTKNILHKPHLVPWAARLAVEYVAENEDILSRIREGDRDALQSAVLQYRDIRDEAGNIGTLGHNIIEDYVNEWIKKGEPREDIRTLIPEGTDPRAWAVARAGEQVFRKEKVTPLATEMLVGSVRHKGAGTLDMLVLTQEGKLEVWDWKSSNQVNDFYACQASAYKYFFQEMTGLKISRTRVFKLDKNSDSFKEYIIPREYEAFRMYLKISNIYDWLYNKEDKIKRNIKYYGKRR